MTPEELRARTKRFALEIIRLVSGLPRAQAGRVIGGQLLRAGTAVGANYRAACKGRSAAEFLAKLGIVEEEADECVFWMELIVEGGLLPAHRVEPLRKEATELVAIMAASKRSLQRRRSH